jgi:hypothetical protein
MKRFGVVPLLVAIVGLGALVCGARAQSAAGSESSFGNASSTSLNVAQIQPGQSYTRPTERIKVRHYLFDTFGPYPIAGAAITGGLDQAGKAPPEWGQGAGAYDTLLGRTDGSGPSSTEWAKTISKPWR